MNPGHRRRARQRRVVVLLVLGLLGSACGAGGLPRGVTDDARPDTGLGDVTPVLRATATVSPLADLVAQIGGERVEVRSLVPPGADAHTYAPRPRDAMRLEDADLYFGIGLALNDGAIRLARTNLPTDARLVLLGEEFLDAADLVFDHPLGAGSTLPRDGAGLGPNPHVWTSLRNARALTRGIAEALSESDPAGADGYASRRVDLLARIDALDAAIVTALATVAPADRVLVTYHDAWIYFARDYGLDYAIAVQGGDYSDPSAAGVRLLIDQVRALGVRAVFGSRVFPSDILERIAEESGATYVPGLSDDILPGEADTPEHTYLEMMRRNARTIVAGLGGDPSALDASELIARISGR